MEVLKNESLASHVTFRIGGIAKNYYIPESIEDLKKILTLHSNYRILSGGSNILINENAEFDCVIDMKKCCLEFNHICDNLFYVGASIRIQKVIKELQEYNCGGFEFLFSLPALFGGIIVMNAGRGSDKKSIGDFIKSVRVLDKDGNIIDIPLEQCMFEYRKSVFQSSNYIVLGAIIECYRIDAAQSMTEVKKRLEHCKNTQDMRFPNFGSLFCYSNIHIMKLIKIVNRVFKTNKKGNGVQLSDRSNNWMINTGNGSFEQALVIIKRIRKTHKLLFQKCEVEVRIWE